MNRRTVSSTVTHGKLSRDPRKTQPLPTVSSTVEPPESSAVTNGSTFRVVGFPVCLQTFQGVLQLDIQGDAQLVGGVPPMTSVCVRRHVSQELKASKGSGWLANQSQNQLGVLL
jgi:hypothetical protein